MSEPTFSAKDLDAIFGPGAASHAAAALERKAAAPILGSGSKVFYHLYVCRFTECVAAANPKAGSLHQRGVHLASSTPRTDVKCPGCGKPMVIGRDGLDAKGNPVPEGHITEDKDGNALFHGQPIIQEAPGQEDQTASIESGDLPGDGTL